MIQKISTVEEMQATSARLRSEGKSIGLVPTMGFFHEGHLSLMRKSVEENDVTITTLFVNPTQFGESEDLDAYPTNIDRDRDMADSVGVDILFAPTRNEMYPEGYKTYIRVDEWSDKLCGITRPIHFRGVTTICCKLFNICRPNNAYFGQKDAQQLLIIKKMVQDLNMDVNIVPMPIFREPDGLAMSSRNVYLTPEERADAVLLNRGISRAREMFAAGNTNAAELKTVVREIMESSPRIKVDYVETVDTKTLEPADQLRSGNTLLAVAAFLGKARLIDNTIF